MSIADSRCPGCDAERPPWITTCATCGASARYPSESVSLADEPAPRVTTEEHWIDIPLAADEPVLVALFRNFCTEREIEFVESRRFVSIRVADARRVLDAITPWAFEHDMPEDPREHDSLATTLHRIGNSVIAAIDEQNGANVGNRPPRRRPGIDLR